jgi:ectoine hydroxylase-related dioxygenase (phytanoyl-CoA dioxygenase family)
MSETMSFSDFEIEGYSILENAITEKTILSLIEALSNLKPDQLNRGIYGVRNLLNLSPKAREFSESKTVREIAEKYLGKEAKVVRAIYFDKTPNANWKVPWHQDLTIAVRERQETNGFTAWTIKDKVHCVQPPIEILDRMLTLRFHLDGADETNGALKILAKTHKLKRLCATQIQNIKSKQTACLCRAKVGDCLVMKPLLLHSSSAGTIPKNRRVIHLEFSADDLPNGLMWHGT